MPASSPETGKPAPRTMPTDDPPPVPPTPPRDDECCGNGCNPCVFDRYDAALERYEAALAAWKKRREAGPGS